MASPIREPPRRDDGETAAIEVIVRATAGLSESEAARVVEIAKSQTRIPVATGKHVVTRELESIATPEQRGRLLECLFEIAATDGAIETVESAGVGEEIGFTRPEIDALRSHSRERLAEFEAR